MLKLECPLEVMQAINIPYERMVWKLHKYDIHVGNKDRVFQWK